jgi:hypothetical protein
MNNTLLHADIFFFISSIGFVVLFALLAVLLGYSISFMKTMNRLGRKVEEDAGVITDEARMFISDIRDSTLYRFLFRKKRPIKK